MFKTLLPFFENPNVNYPFEKEILAPRTRGVIALDSEACTSCMLCARSCPDWCIYIEGHKELQPPSKPGGRQRSRAVLDRFDIDYALCMYCGICVEVCPFDALFWSPEYEYSEFSMGDMLHDKDIHAAIFLVFTLATTAVLFILLSAEFVALVLILVYIGAVIVLFLFGVMITRAPLGPNAELDNDQNKLMAAVISLSIFGIFTYILLQTFDSTVVISEGTSTKLLGEILLSRFVFPFELVSFVLLGALIGGITLARKDNALMDEDQI